MNAKYTVGQYLVDRLHQLGLDHLFSIAGDYSIRWVHGYVAESPITIIEEVNELNAGYAADGYARFKGIGALCVTYSAGALCAVNAIAGAFVERVPVVLINGTPDIKKTLAFEQTGFSAHHFISGRETDMQAFEHLTAATVRVDNPDLAGMLIDYALTQCITERRPVYIELLQDVVDMECQPPAGELRPARMMSDETNLIDAILTIGARLERAANPLIWVGIEVDRMGLHAQAAELVAQLNVPYVTELLSKSVLPEDDPLFAGVFDGQASSPEVQRLAKDADFILALGVWLTDLNSLGWNPDFDKTAFVSFDTVKYGTYFQPQVSLDHFIGGLTERRISRPTSARPVPVPGPAAPASWDLTARITYPGFYDFIARYVDKDTIVGSDASLNYFGAVLLKVPSARAFFAQPSYSSIGYIAPAATGVCLAKRDEQRVVVFAGDGGFQMSAQCLSTQTRFGLNPIIFVINNGVYGVEQWLADPTVFYTNQNFYESCLLHPWEYSKLAEVFGCQGWKVATYHDLGEAVKDAIANTNSPSIIQVVMDDKSIPENAEWKKT
jgi:indolepyruvate decarboxylase